MASDRDAPPVMKLSPKDNVAVALRPLRAGESLVLDGVALTIDRNIAVGHKLAAAQTDVLSLTDYETHLSIKAQFLLDAVLGLINTKQNDIFTVLTVVSVVGIPPTLVASIYGMNFKNMPELSWAWGYQWGLAMIALSTIVPILWFKWRGWL